MARKLHFTAKSYLVWLLFKNWGICCWNNCK